jgi:hypothetical protein
MIRRYRLCLTVAAGLLLTGCAGPQPTTATDTVSRQDCISDAPTGTNIQRKDKACIAMTQKERDAARAQFERMSDQSDREAASRAAERTR